MKYECRVIRGHCEKTIFCSAVMCYLLYYSWYHAIISIIFFFYFRQIDLICIIYRQDTHTGSKYIICKIKNRLPMLGRQLETWFIILISLSVKAFTKIYKVKLFRKKRYLYTHTHTHTFMDKDKMIKYRMNIIRHWNYIKRFPWYKHFIKYFYLFLKNKTLI